MFNRSPFVARSRIFLGRAPRSAASNKALSLSVEARGARRSRDFDRHAPLPRNTLPRYYGRYKKFAGGMSDGRGGTRCIAEDECRRAVGLA